VKVKLVNLQVERKINLSDCSKWKCVKCSVSVVNREASVEACNARIQIYPLHIEVNFGGKFPRFQCVKVTEQKCVKC
jgi:hypothetical protein